MLYKLIRQFEWLLDEINLLTILAFYYGDSETFVISKDHDILDKININIFLPI